MSFTNRVFLATLLLCSAVLSLPSMAVAQFVGNPAQRKAADLAYRGITYYGNYCGRGNSQFSKRPIDRMDAACQRHDIHYGRAQKVRSKKEAIRIQHRADVQLLSDLRNLTRKDLPSDRAWAYRSRAMLYFKGKINVTRAKKSRTK